MHKVVSKEQPSSENSLSGGKRIHDITLWKAVRYQRNTVAQARDRHLVLLQQVGPTGEFLKQQELRVYTVENEELKDRDKQVLVNGY